MPDKDACAVCHKPDCAYPAREPAVVNGTIVDATSISPGGHVVIFKPQPSIIVQANEDALAALARRRALQGVWRDLLLWAFAAWTVGYWLTLVFG